MKIPQTNRWFVVPALSVMGAFFVFFNTYAAVPTYVVEMDAETKFEKSLERFMFELFTKLSQKEEDFIKAFELAKIEKAREDVNKLLLQVEKEVKEGNVDLDEQTIGKDSVKLRKAPRVIEDVDAFLFEEPTQKARDFLYCYLHPQRDFPLGDDIGAYCKHVLGVVDPNDSEKCNAEIVCKAVGAWDPGYPTDPSDDKCATAADWDSKTGEYKKVGATTKICDVLAEKNKICPSREIRDNLRTSIVNAIQRRNMADIPPEQWYNNPLVCDTVFRMMLCDKNNQACRQKIEPSIGVSLAFQRRQFSLGELINTAENENNSIDKLQQAMVSAVQGIIETYQQIRLAQYQAGQGVRGEKFLFGFKCRGGDPKNPKQYPGKCPSDFYYLDVEQTLSPGIFLVNKVAAASQAMFDLARMGFKLPSVGANLESTRFETIPLSIREVKAPTKTSSESPTRVVATLPDWLRVNESQLKFEGATVPFKKLTYPALVAPWEDKQNYTKIPDTYNAPDVVLVKECVAKIFGVCVFWGGGKEIQQPVKDQRSNIWFHEVFKPKGNDELGFVFQQWFGRAIEENKSRCSLIKLGPICL